MEGGASFHNEKCFHSCEFLPVVAPEQQTSSDDDYDDIPLAVHKLTSDLFGCEFKDLVKIDGDLATQSLDQINWNLPAKNLLAADTPSDDHDDADEDYEDATSPEPATPITLNQAQDHLSALQQFALQQGSTSLLSAIMDINQTVIAMRMSCSSKQSKISDFIQ